MRMNTMFRLALASILTTGMASTAFAQTYRDETAPPPADTAPLPADVPSTDTTDDLRGDGVVPGTADPTMTRDTVTRPQADTPMSTTASTPLAFELFDRRWCVGDGPTPLACDVRVVPPGPDAFTMFGQTWCLNDAPGRACDVRVRGDGVIDDDDDDDVSG